MPGSIGLEGEQPEDPGRGAGRLVRPRDPGRELRQGYDIHHLLNVSHEGTSVRVALRLIEMGYKNAYALKGGWWEWVGAGYPMESK